MQRTSAKRVLHRYLIRKARRFVVQDFIKLPVREWPAEFMRTLQLFRKDPLWNKYKRLRAREADVVGWFREHGHPQMTVADWKAIQQGLTREAVQGAMRAMRSKSSEKFG